ncbi:MAG: isocitrate/isopropylmalate dehydrogenase family protein [Clostridium sp.]
MGYDITLIPGDGIGPEVTAATVEVLKHSGVDINWISVKAGEETIATHGTPLPEEVLETIRKTKIALKGPITTPVGKGFRSVNVGLRQSLNLYANVRPVKTYKGIKSRYDNVNLTIVRENTEDLYAGIEHMVGEDAAESIKIITRKASERIVDFAFNYAINEGRKKVTAVHKANIMKCSDGLFLSCAKDVAEKYQDSKVEFEDMIVDAMSMRMVQVPENYDVLVMPNLYGDILSDIGAGLVGGLGVTPGANIGDGIAVFEPVHGSAPDIAGRGISNPTATILSAVMMLRHIGEFEAADKVENAIKIVLEKGETVTGDLGGNSTTQEFTQAVIKEMM